MLIDHRALAVCATMGLAMLPGVTRANLLTNGNFASVCGSGSFCAYGAGNSTSIPTWTVGSGGVDLITGYWQSPPGGGNSIDLDELAPGSVQTSFGTNAGTEYMLSFELSGNPDGGNPVKTVEVDVAGVIQTFTFDTSIAGNNKSNMKWVLETLTFTATGATTNLEVPQPRRSGFGVWRGDRQCQRCCGSRARYLGAVGRRTARNRRLRSSQVSQVNGPPLRSTKAVRAYASLHFRSA